LRRQVKVSNDVTQVGKILKDIQGNPGTTSSFFPFATFKIWVLYELNKTVFSRFAEYGRSSESMVGLFFILRGSIEGWKNKDEKRAIQKCAFRKKNWSTQKKRLSKVGFF